MRRGAATMADHNKLLFEAPRIVEQYARLDTLTSAETQIFAEYRSDYVNRRVLDLGVGAGRTTPTLACRASSYLGIDYSTAMVARCRRRFPDISFKVGDARDLTALAAGSLDFVLFSFNGLDFADHSDRIRVLRQVHRVLVAGGVFAFSSHSLDWIERRKALSDLFLHTRPGNPLDFIKSTARIGLRSFNYLRNVRQQKRGRDQAILIDPGHDYSIPTYYIRPAAQVRQLIAAGFDSDVRILPECPPGVSAESPYAYYYVARKQAAPLRDRLVPTGYSAHPGPATVSN